MFKFEHWLLAGSLRNESRGAIIAVAGAHYSRVEAYTIWNDV